MRFLLITLLLSTVCYSQTNEYTISFENSAHHEAVIKATFPNLKTQTVTARMSRTSPGRYALHEFAKNVYGFKATNSKGETLPVRRPDPYSWEITGHDGTVHITYTIFANRGDGTYSQVDESYYDRAMKHQTEGHFIVGGKNYGQGSSREHAAIAPRYLGVRAVIAKSYARIHRQNLCNFGILPLLFENDADYDDIGQEDILEIPDARKAIDKESFEVANKTKNKTYKVKHGLSELEKEWMLAGSLINVVLARHKGAE